VRVVVQAVMQINDAKISNNAVLFVFIVVIINVLYLIQPLDLLYIQREKTESATSECKIFPFSKLIFSRNLKI
jgi:hypothetical protein